MKVRLFLTEVELIWVALLDSFVTTAAVVIVPLTFEDETIILYSASVDAPLLPIKHNIVAIMVQNKQCTQKYNNHTIE